jgi:hypothetical protein
MERRLAGMKSGVPNRIATKMADEWSASLTEDMGDLDPRIAEIEAANMAKHYHRWHVERLGTMTSPRPDGVFRILGGQLNSASSAEVRSRKVKDVVGLINEWEVQAGCLSEVGVNWSSYPSSANLASWFRDEIQDIKTHTAHNKHENVAHHQPGGTATFACRELARYTKERTTDSRGLGRWCSTLFYADPTHKFRLVSAYHVGRHKPRGSTTIFQQHLRYIQNTGLSHSPSRLFVIDFIAQLQTWQRQGDRLLIFIDMNEHILRGHLAKYMSKMGLTEATHSRWGTDNEPHTYFRGTEPIDGVWHSPSLDVVATLQLSFHEGVGDHRTALVDITTSSAIGKQEFRVVHPAARRLSSGNVKARDKYLAHFERQMEIHRMSERLHECERQAIGYPVSEEVRKKMQALDTQVVEIQRASERQCRQIYRGTIPFSEPVRTIYIRKRAYQELARGCSRPVQRSNVVRDAIKAGISGPRALTLQQCLDGVEACTRKLAVLKHQAGGLRQVHLRDCLIQAKTTGNDRKYKDILCTIEREEQKSIWKRINRAIDEPSLGAVPFVQREVQGEIVDIYETQEMNREIQEVTEERFDRAMSAPITMTSLRERLGFLSDTEFAKEMLKGDVHIPSDVDPTTTLVLEEIIRLFGTLHEGHTEIGLRADEFRHYWRRVREKTSSSLSGIHFGHYKSAAHSPSLSDFFARKITLIARCGCPPERWGHGLQVLLEKIAGVALVSKLRAILLMEGDFNYMNKWVFGYDAINKLYEMGYVPGDQYSQRESTAEDARMDNRLTMDLSRQLKHPLATMSADADKCYDRINHIVMSLLLMAIVGSVGTVAAMLSPIQSMKFFQRTARGDSTTFMGGRGKDNPLQGLCQGNGAAPACWLMLSSVLMHCYRRQGFGSRILSPISGAIIDFLGEIYVDDTDLIITRPEFTTPEGTQEGLRDAAWAWASGLNATGGAINPDKSRWIYAGYEWNSDGTWTYANQPELPMDIPLPDGSPATISQAEVSTAEKSLGVWSTVDGNDSVHIDQNIKGRTKKWISKMTNGHLSARLGWIAYRFKLWPGIRYGLATLAMPMETAKTALSKENYLMLPFLGINRNVKREWRTLHRAFGGIGMLDLAVEHTICMINIFVQHYGTGTTIALKFRACLETLQLELGCLGNPLTEDYGRYSDLATDSWVKSLWQRLHHFRFSLHIEYDTLPLPRRHDASLVAMFVRGGYSNERLQALNRCRISHKLIFLSDISTACGRFIDPEYILPPSQVSVRNRISSYIFPTCKPSRADWALWREFWGSATGANGLLHIALGGWVHSSHSQWIWFHCAYSDTLFQRQRHTTATYTQPEHRSRIRSKTVYRHTGYTEAIPQHCVPAHVIYSPEGEALLRCKGPHLFDTEPAELSFWEYLRSLGGEWMWDNIIEGHNEVDWIRTALESNTFIGVTDGSYNRERASTVSGSGWVICCTKSKRILRGSFHETSPKAGSYRGELLGLVAIHTFIASIATFYKLDQPSGKICCDNLAALDQSGRQRRRVRTGIKHADLHRTIRTIKQNAPMKMVYEHVRAHQDRILPWSVLSLEQQLNVICDELANDAVKRAISEGAPGTQPKLLPHENAAVILDGVKITTDVGAEVRYRLGKEDAERFYTKPRNVVQGTNRGGLGWSQERFHSVAWHALEATLKSKPDMFQVWLSKQCIGICATRRNTARIQDILDDKCPNCLQPRETNTHLNRCPDAGRTLLFKESTTLIVDWMHQHNRTDAELAYWIEKYLIYRGTRTLTSLVALGGESTPGMLKAAASQDLIGWTEFLHGKISTDIEMIQGRHCVLSSCRSTASDWMKGLASHLIQASHSQWIYRNFTLHDKQRGYLQLQKRKDLLRELDKLIDTPPDEIPEGSQYLLELDYSELYNSSFENQSYWVLAMKAARRAGLREKHLSSRSRRKRRSIPGTYSGRPKRHRPRFDFSQANAQIERELGLTPRHNKRALSSATDATNPSNKRFRKPD